MSRVVEQSKARAQRVLSIIGINHRTAPVTVREEIALSESDVRAALRAVRRRPEVDEALILSTCNRFELYVLGDGSVDHTLCTELLSGIGRRTIPEPGRFYTHTGDRAVRHLIRVACGLDSLCLGEHQIQAQVRRALQLALRTEAAGGTFSRLVASALRAGRRVRSETTLGQGTRNLSEAAMELAEKVYGDLRGLNALVVGAGKTGLQTAAFLQTSGARIRVSNRTEERAQELVDRVGGEVWPFARIHEALADVDLVISQTGARHPVFRLEAARGPLAARRGRPLLIVDLAVPRDVDPTIREMECVFLHDIDALGDVIRYRHQDLEAELRRADRIVDDERERFLRWEQGCEVGPLISALRGRFETVRRETIEEHAAHLTEEERERLKETTRLMMRRILDLPSRRLRALSAEEEEERQARMDALRELFEL